MRVVWIIIDLTSGFPEPADYQTECEARQAIRKLALDQNRSPDDWACHRIECEG
jgi:hypothetical protein